MGHFDDIWQWLEEEHIGGHHVALISRTVDGFPQWEVVVDCVAQYHGGMADTAKEYRRWVRQLRKNERERARKAKAGRDAKCG